MEEDASEIDGRIIVGGRCKESPPEPGGSGQCRFVWLMGLSNLSKDLSWEATTGGREGETKADRWSEGRSSSIAQSPGRGGGGGGSHEQE